MNLWSKSNSELIELYQKQNDTLKTLKKYFDNAIKESRHQMNKEKDLTIMKAHSDCLHNYKTVLEYLKEV